MDKKILILNSGSSSIKFQVLNMPGETRICQGMAERIGTGAARLTFQIGEDDFQQDLGDADHGIALEAIAKILQGPGGVLSSGSDALAAVGHRVVHGGTRFSSTTLVTGEVKDAISELSHLAPLHNPHNLNGIEVAARLFPDIPQVAVFDTAFHGSIPAKARKYAIPNQLFNEKGVQVYGFHGTSHKFVSRELRQHLPPDGGRLISLHLGNGCSITAIHQGKSVDHSLGFTPSNGLIMGSRSGDIDHGIIFYLVETLGYSLKEVERLLNTESGLLGLTGKSDMRDIEKAAAQGDTSCQLALEMSAYRIQKYIGSYYVVLNGLDALVFTAGIGEHSQGMRERVCKGLESLGIRLDPEKNQQPGSGMRAIHAANSEVAIWIVPTDEELEIARQTFQVIQ